MIWKRKGNNHELFHNGKKIGTIVGKTKLRPGFSSNYDKCGMAGCVCMTQPTITTYIGYFHGKKVNTFHSIKQAKNYLENLNDLET